LRCFVEKLSPSLDRIVSLVAQLVSLFGSKCFPN